MKTLKEQREELNEAVNMSYSPDDFPGSSMWKRTQQLLKQLNDFDQAHPEILSQIKVDRKAHDAKIAEKVGWI